MSVKALIFDGERLLIFKDKDGAWEIPGGGWEHDESLEACLARELKEEMQIEVTGTGGIAFCWRTHAEERGERLRLAVPVTIASHVFVPSDDDLVEARFVSKDEFLALPFHATEQGIQACVDEIWPAPAAN